MRVPMRPFSITKITEMCRMRSQLHPGRPGGRNSPSTMIEFAETIYWVAVGYGLVAIFCYFLCGR
jgi:hypothetical protein